MAKKNTRHARRTPRRPRAPAAPPAPPSPPLDVEVHLTIQHDINGTLFSPGTVRVPRDVADVLLEQERRHDEHEESFYAKNRAFLIGAGNRKIPVPYESFDEFWQNPHPTLGFGTFSKLGRVG